jgi:hypothetical protein
LAPLQADEVAELMKDKQNGVVLKARSWYFKTYDNVSNLPFKCFFKFSFFLFFFFISFSHTHTKVLCGLRSSSMDGGPLQHQQKTGKKKKNKAKIISNSGFFSSFINRQLKLEIFSFTRTLSNTSPTTTHLPMRTSFTK